MSVFRTARVVLSCLLAIGAGACNFDEAELVRPGASVITAEVGQLRVLSYPVDPAAGDDWVDVLAPDPNVVEEADGYAEDDGARLADRDEAADRRRLFTAVGTGRTLLVEVNCRGCRNGIPTTPSSDTSIHVWDFVIDPTTSDLTAGTDVAVPDAETTQPIGGYVVVVRAPAADVQPLEIRPVDGDPVSVRRIASHAPDAGADLYVDVFVATTTGGAEILDPGTGTVYAVRVTG